jgi:hypothetical protein
MNAIVLIALRRPYTFVVLAILILLFGAISVLQTATDVNNSQNYTARRSSTPLADYPEQTGTRVQATRATFTFDLLPTAKQPPAYQAKRAI